MVADQTAKQVANPLQKGKKKSKKISSSGTVELQY
jgi:hypothetical protein